MDIRQFTQSILAVFALSVFFAASHASAQNLLANGDFENSAPNPGNGASFLSGWNEIWNFGIAGQDLVNADNLTLQNWGIETLYAGQGLVSAKNFYDGGIYQQVSVIAGQNYTFSGMLFVPSATGASNSFDPSASSPSVTGTFANVIWLRSDLTEISRVSNPGITGGYDQWSPFSGLVKAPAGTSFARVEIGTFFQGNIIPPHPTLFDNFSLQLGAVPEPGTYGMLALGLGIMIPAIRRRMKNIKGVNSQHLTKNLLIEGIRKLLRIDPDY